MAYKHAEWADFKLSLDGVNINGIRGIRYSKDYEDEHLHAAGRDPIGIQSGNITYEGEIKILKADVDAMNIAAQAAGYDDISDVPNLVIVATYLPKGARIIKTDTLTGCKIGKLEQGWDQGAMHMDITLPFKFTGLKKQ